MEEFHMSAAIQTVPKTVQRPIKPVGFTIQSRESRTETRFLKLLVYGDYGVGKTYLAGTAADVADMQNVILLSAESGELTLDSTDKHNFDSIDSIKVTGFMQASKIHGYLFSHCQARDAGNTDRLKALQAEVSGVDVADIADEDVKVYRTVVIDSLTELEQYCMMQLLGIDEKSSWETSGKSAEWSEYKKQYNMMTRLVRAYRDLSMHVIFLCSRKYTTDDSNRQLFQPQLTGKLAGAVQGFVDIVGYLECKIEIVEGKSRFIRALNVQPIDRYAAKCRFSNYTKSKFIDPTLKNILTAVGLITTD